MSSVADVKVLLELASIEPNPDELEEMAVALSAMKARIERLWAVDVGETPPSLVFRSAEWSGPAER